MNISSELITAAVTLLTFLGGIITYMINNEVKILKQAQKNLKDEMDRNELALQATIARLELSQQNADRRYHDDVKEIFEAIKSIGREISDFKVSQTKDIAAMDSGIKTDLAAIKLSLASNYMSKEECEKRIHGE